MQYILGQARHMRTFHPCSSEGPCALSAIPTAQRLPWFFTSGWQEREKTCGQLYRDVLRPRLCNSQERLFPCFSVKVSICKRSQCLCPGKERKVRECLHIHCSNYFLPFCACHLYIYFCMHKYIVYCICWDCSNRKSEYPILFISKVHVPYAEEQLCLSWSLRIPDLWRNHLTNIFMVTRAGATVWMLFLLGFMCWELGQWCSDFGKRWDL